MKVSIGMKIQSGAWGGGNQFGATLTAYLRDRGVTVSHDLAAPDLDIILLAEPDRKLRVSAYDHRDILKYLLLRNRRCLVVHRINNTSEAREDPAKRFNHFRINANRVADHTVFISDWVKRRYQESGFGTLAGPAPRTSTIIANGANHHLFRSAPARNRPGPLKVVTHHWSNHPNKGFDIYERLDGLLQEPTWANRLSFTYIGRLPEHFSFKAGRHLAPLAGEKLAVALAAHDFYLTASQHEAAGMHHIEAALCGLPLLYRQSGALPEYCQGFGLSFTAENFESRLGEMVDTLPHWTDRVKEYPFTAERMCENYFKLFQDLLAQRSEMVARRRWWRNPAWLVRTLLDR